MGGTRHPERKLGDSVEVTWQVSSALLINTGLQASGFSAEGEHESF
jgi:hypothetical protein